MNKNELQVLIDYTKGMIADNKEPERKVIIALCDELERIIGKYPVGFASEKELRNLNIKFTTLYPLKTSNHNIPLYRLD
ncbi:TPA: hypothetical protein ACXNNH_000241 [Proteus mirabilis]|uniref:hypothetical protein n=1 Tax=Proteus mirabilis TaxID=584 RepID=UPI0018C51769|nr:hypothetical protein [Proteus mirabilis]MBG6034232.1 hypothetical protein [Proteus mirabilis]MBI6393946.1 hypothetical protein [Proteus mirabilis]MBI6491790.1 hypothetical protein [Proteus mirabilis]MBS3883468.1 hypothetical protein [Proteus mirabilis]HBC5887469.1 hypothetical protein [Proteus mirabilis]